MVMVSSNEPTCTTPFATAAEESAVEPVARLHCKAPVLAFSAYTLWSNESK